MNCTLRNDCREVGVCYMMLQDHIDLYSLATLLTTTFLTFLGSRLMWEWADGGWADVWRILQNTQNGIVTF